MEAVHSLTVANLLGTWDSAAELPAAERTLALLVLACPGQPREALLALSSGQRDRRLLDLREALFGPELVCLADCPQCGDRLELTFSVRDVRMAAYKPPEVLEIAGEGYDVRFRLPTLVDLAALADVSDSAEAKSALLRRCLLSVRQQDDECDLDTLPHPLVDAIADRMEEADQQAISELPLRCRACGHRWVADFDIASFLWPEIDAWACRTLSDIHVLARAYGWSESEILALSGRRRQLYLQLATA